MFSTMLNARDTVKQNMNGSCCPGVYGLTEEQTVNKLTDEYVMVIVL